MKINTREIPLLKLTQVLVKIYWIHFFNKIQTILWKYLIILKKCKKINTGSKK